MGRRVSDKFTVPICRLHHRELHRRGNERGWWESQGIDPLAVAATVWARTHASAPPADLAGHMDMQASVKGEHVGAAPGMQIDETNPILRLEAE